MSEFKLPSRTSISDRSRSFDGLNVRDPDVPEHFLKIGVSRGGYTAWSDLSKEDAQALVAELLKRLHL